MTAHHTPGPWRQEYIGQDGHILITDEQGVTIATCWKQPPDPREWVRGNAGLIEAAPDLRDALIAVIGWVIEKEEGSAYKAQIQKPVAFAKAVEALKAAGVDPNVIVAACKSAAA